MNFFSVCFLATQVQAAIDINISGGTGGLDGELTVTFLDDVVFSNIDPADLGTFIYGILIIDALQGDAGAFSAPHSGTTTWKDPYTTSATGYGGPLSGGEAEADKTIYDLELYWTGKTLSLSDPITLTAGYRITDGLSVDISSLLTQGTASYEVYLISDERYYISDPGVTSAIPEPETTVLFLGISSLILAFIMNKRKGY